MDTSSPGASGGKGWQRTGIDSRKNGFNTGGWLLGDTLVFYSIFSSAVLVQQRHASTYQQEQRLGPPGFRWHGTHGTLRPASDTF
jgi:hypothetical protein